MLKKKITRHQRADSNGTVIYEKKEEVRFLMGIKIYSYSHEFTCDLENKKIGFGEIPKI